MFPKTLSQVEDVSLDGNSADLFSPRAQCFAGFLAYLVVLNDYGYPPRVLFQRGLNWSTNALMCTVDANNVPIECGYGCNNPDYAAVRK